MGRPRLPALAAPLLTPRFELRPIGGTELALRQYRLLQDAEIRGLLTHRKEPPTLIGTLARTRRNNRRTRFYHAVIDRQTGTVIGTHTIRIVPHRTATLAVTIDKAWWGRNVVTEIRKALIVTLVRHCGIAHVSSRVHSRNFASIFNYARLGFENAGTLHMCEYDQMRDEPADYLIFSLRGDALAEAVNRWEGENALVAP